VNKVRVVGTSKRNWWWVPVLVAGAAIVLTAKVTKSANTPYIYRTDLDLCDRRIGA